MNFNLHQVISVHRIRWEFKETKIVLKKSRYTIKRTRRVSIMYQESIQKKFFFVNNKQYKNKQLLQCFISLSPRL